MGEYQQEAARLRAALLQKKLDNLQNGPQKSAEQLMLAANTLANDNTKQSVKYQKLVFEQMKLNDAREKYAKD